MLVLVRHNHTVGARIVLTKKLDKIATFGLPRGKNTESICSAGILAANLDRDSRPSGAGLDTMRGSKLNQISHTDTSISLNVLEISAEALKTSVLIVGAFVGENE